MRDIKVSFDFDGTLSKFHIQEYAKKLVKQGIECWIVTSRMGFGREPRSDWNDDLFKVANLVGIPKERIHFCCMSNKADFLKGKGFLWHIDDDLIELDFIRTDSDCIPISCFGNPNHIEECNKLIKTIMGNFNLKTEILKAAINKYGTQPQLEMVIEECMELALALQRLKRPRGKVDEKIGNVIDEIADVKIMIRQAEMILGEDLVAERVEFKINRLAKRLEEDK